MSNKQMSSRNALIIKIALFLNFLSKNSHSKLIHQLESLQKKNQDIDVLKIMLAGKYVTPGDLAALKKICVRFAKTQADSRLGSLCVNFGFLTQSNVDLALEEQKRLADAGEHVLLGDLLVDAGMLSKQQRNLLLKKQKVGNAARKATIPGTEAEDEPEFDKTNMREIREAEFILLVSNDGLTAYITKTDVFDDSMLLSDFKFLLEKNGIIYGLADDDSIETFIKNTKYSDTFFEIAKGLEPIDGTDTQFVFMFERDYLKPGELSENGTIDFKARGEIPFVSQGDILAERIPSKAGKDGVNVYGDVIPKAETEDMAFNPGKGVRISTDGLKAIAEVEGNPKVKPGGEISVNGAYYIEGDVDYTTGHIKFDKNVYITGTIKSGFKVEAIDVVADTIDGGTVQAQGDVFIQNGVTESSIESKGDIKAGFIHRSKASCMGNMTIVKEIVDTEIVMEGRFDMPRGRMFSSSVCAKGGAIVYNIGSERSKPSSITVGPSTYLETELKNLDAAIDSRQNSLDDKTADKNKIEAELAITKEKLFNLNQSRQRTLSMIQEMKKNSSEKEDSKVDLFQKSLDEAEKKNLELDDRQAVLESRLRKTSKEITFYTESVTRSVKEKFELKRIHQANPPRPVLNVTGKILPGTKVNGRHSSLVIRESLSRTRVMEMNPNTDGSGSKKNWEMIISSL